MMQAQILDIAYVIFPTDT